MSVGLKSTHRCKPVVPNVTHWFLVEPVWVFKKH